MNCRHYDDKKAEVEQGFWNCPCVPMRCVPGQHSFSRSATISQRTRTHPSRSETLWLAMVFAAPSRAGNLRKTGCGGTPDVCAAPPVVPDSERKECHCMLFLTEDNDFAGREQACILFLVACAAPSSPRASLLGR